MQVTQLAVIAVDCHADSYFNKVTAPCLFCLIVPLRSTVRCHRQLGAKLMWRLGALQGFYTVYNTVFQKLAQEERQAAAQQTDQQGSDSLPSLPAFGKL